MVTPRLDQKADAPNALVLVMLIQMLYRFELHFAVKLRIRALSSRARFTNKLAELIILYPKIGDAGTS